MNPAVKFYAILGAMIMSCLALGPVTKADTTFVSGTIHFNTTWTPDGNPFIVIGDTRVDTNITLTIQPAVQVRLNSGITFTIDGALYARGTASDSIVFTGNEGAHWGQLTFNNSSVDSVCFLEYCLIELASYYGIYCSDASPVITNNSITGNGYYPNNGHGIYVMGTGSSPIIADNLIRGNQSSQHYGGKGGGIYIGQGASPVITGNTITQNSSSGYYVGWGGGIYIALGYGGFPILSENIIDSNNAYTSGGGIYISGHDQASPSSVILSCNSISYNSSRAGSGILADLGLANLALFGNTITANVIPGKVNATAVKFDASSSIVNMNYNNIYDNSDLIHSVFEVYAGSGSSPINGENNWWGTTDPSMIDLLIYDFWDDPNLREIVFVTYSTDFNSAPLESIIVIAPNGGEEWFSDAFYHIQWNPFCFTDDVRIEYSTNGGLTWVDAVESTKNVGFYLWEVPVLLSTNCRVRVYDAADSIPADMSDNNFTICPGPTIVVAYPNGGEVLSADSTYDITWNSYCFDSSVKIEYSTNGGADWTTIVADTVNIGSVAWTGPDTTSLNCRVKVSDALDGDPFDISDDDFSVYICGDVNGGGGETIDIADLVYLVDYMFMGGPPPPVTEAADVDASGALDIADLVYLVDYMFNQGPEPTCP